MLAHLSVVTNDKPDPPYPSDLRAKGMKFALDMERIKQSTAWIKCPPGIRSHLLLLWAESWVSAPIGTYEPDDEIIAGRIGMDPDLFRLHRRHLMHGWYEASDGRLYHRHISTLAVEMAASRRKDAARMKAWRDGNSTGMSRVTSANSHVSSDLFAAGTGNTSSSSPTSKKKMVVGDCPQEELLAAWAELMPDLPQPVTWAGQRQQHMRTRWREAWIRLGFESKEDGVEWWRRLLAFVRESDFLMGRTDRPFALDLPWMIRPANFANIIDRKYHTRRSQ